MELSGPQEVLIFWETELSSLWLKKFIIFLQAIFSYISENRNF